MFLILVFGSGPEKAFQTIPFTPGHDVGMQMRNALADAVINRDEGAFSVESLFDGPLEPLHGLKERADFSSRQIVQRDNVVVRYK